MSHFSQKTLDTVSAAIRVHGSGMWVGIGEGYSQLVGTPPNVEWVTPKAILLGNQGCWTPISLEQAEELVVALQTKIKELRGAK